MMKQKAKKSTVKVQDLGKKKTAPAGKELEGVKGGGGISFESIGDEFAGGGHTIGNIGEEFAGTVTPTIVKGKR